MDELDMQGYTMERVDDAERQLVTDGVGGSMVAAGVLVGDAPNDREAVGVWAGVRVPDGVSAPVDVELGVSVPVAVIVPDRVAVPVLVAVRVTVAVMDMDAVPVPVVVTDGVAVIDPDWLDDGDGVAVTDHE